MVVESRPEWTHSVSGIPIDCVVKVLGGSTGSKPDIIISRNKVSLVKPGSLQAKHDDEFDASYVFGPEATNKDLFQRTVLPLLRKTLEGYNVAIIAFGATGSGKTTVLEGTRTMDLKSGPEGDGIIHMAIDALYEMMISKASTIADAMAKKRRYGSRGFEFLLESTFLELYSEECHDLYQKGAAVKSNLPVVEDELEGWAVPAAVRLASKTASEMRCAFNMGREARDMQVMDLGSVHERTAALYTITLSQFSPASQPGEEDRIMVSQALFVDLPGCERLAVEPELLRLREGISINRGLLAFGAAVRELSKNGVEAHVNYEDSLLTKLMAESLGGNFLTLAVGTLKQGDWEQSVNAMKYVALIRNVTNFPVINHGRSRGLLQRLRRRMLAIHADRETLRDQLDDTPADFDPSGSALSLARFRDLEARLMEERAEKAALLEDKQAAMARLMALKDAGSDDLKEKSELQDALIHSEEQRLEVGRALLDFELEFNDAKQTWENEKFELEQKILDLEGQHLDKYVRADDHSALAQERDELNSQLLALQDELARKGTAMEAMEKELEDLRQQCHKLNRVLNTLGVAADGEDVNLDEGEANGEEADEEEEEAFAGLPENLKNMSQARFKLFKKLKSQERTIKEHEAEIGELKKDADRLHNHHTLTKVGADELREAYRRKLEGLVRNVADVGRAVAIMESDRGTGLRVSPDDLFQLIQQLLEENMQVSESREAEMREELNELSARHLEMKRKFRSLISGYREMKYRIEDSWPSGSEPPIILRDDEVLSAAQDGELRGDDEADRRQLVKLRQRTSHLVSQVNAMKIAESALAAGLKPKANFQPPIMGFPDVTRSKEGERTMMAESREMEMLRAENEALKAAAKMSQVPNTGGDAHALQRQLKEFAAKTQMELERKHRSAESRAVMAEEQLDSLQKYITQASVQYQREIVRLRAIIGQLDPTGEAMMLNPLTGSKR